MFTDPVRVNASCTHSVRQVPATSIIVDPIAVAVAPCERALRKTKSSILSCHVPRLLRNLHYNMKHTYKVWAPGYLIHFRFLHYCAFNYLSSSLLRITSITKYTRMGTLLMIRDVSGTRVVSKPLSLLEARAKDNNGLNLSCFLLAHG